MGAEMDFWYSGFRQAIHKDLLVALILDINNWRPGEIAKITDIEVESPRIVSLGLQFSDMHEHTEKTFCGELVNPCLRLKVPDTQTIGVYYRYAKALNGNPADHAMIDGKRGLNDLFRDYDYFMASNSGDRRISHLGRPLLDVQYKMIFQEPLPLN